MTTSLSTCPLFKVDSYIDGAWVTTENRFEVRNPADGEVIARVADGGAELAERAIDAAAPALHLGQDGLFVRGDGDDQAGCSQLPEAVLGGQPTAQPFESPFRVVVAGEPVAFDRGEQRLQRRAVARRCQPAGERAEVEQGQGCGRRDEPAGQR